MSKTLSDVVREGASRFDSKPLYRASLEAIRELRAKYDVRIEDHNLDLLVAWAVSLNSGFGDNVVLVVEELRELRESKRREEAFSGLCCLDCCVHNK